MQQVNPYDKKSVPCTNYPFLKEIQKDVNRAFKDNMWSPTVVYAWYYDVIGQVEFSPYADYVERNDSQAIIVISQNNKFWEV